MRANFHIRESTTVADLVLHGDAKQKMGSRHTRSWAGKKKTHSQSGKKAVKKWSLANSYEAHPERLQHNYWWMGAYHRALTQAGYDHHTVCHKRNFVDPVTRAHTQHLERAWKTYKMDIWRHRGNRTTKLLKELLKVIEWEYWLARNHPSHILGRLIHDIRKYNLHECG